MCFDMFYVFSNFFAWFIKHFMLHVLKVMLFQIKCDQYWPHDMESVVYGDLQVTKTKEETTSPWVVRDLTICMVSLYHYLFC